MKNDKSNTGTETQANPDAGRLCLQRVVRPLFLYLKSNKPSAKELSKIETAGYVPVAVESFEAVKIVEPTFPISADIDLLTREAFAAISKYPHAGIRELFGKRVADAIAV